MIPRRSTAAASLLVVLSLALPSSAVAHTIPDDVTIQMLAKPDGERFHLLVRIPFNALADVIFPLRAEGDLDLAQAEALLPGAATTWLSDWIDLYEDQNLLAKPRIVETRLALASDNSFASYEEAWAHVTGARLPGNMEIYPYQAMVDVSFDYPIRSDRSSFAIHSRLSRLGVRVVTAMQFLPASGALRTYGYLGDPGLFRLDAPWREAVQRFVPLGFSQILKGTDYLLFLLCVALLFAKRAAPNAAGPYSLRRHFAALLPFVAAFTVAHSITLIASAYNFAPDALWFPVLFETLIALSIVYLALDNIVEGTPARYRSLIAFGFGLVYGFGFSFALRPALQFGGSHVLASVLSFNAGIELGQIFVLALLVLVLTLLFRLGVPERIGTIFLAALAAHTGWHRMLDRAQWLSVSQFQWPALDPALWTAALRWAILLLVLAGLGYLVFGVIRPRAIFNRERVE